MKRDLELEKLVKESYMLVIEDIFELINEIEIYRKENKTYTRTNQKQKRLCDILQTYIKNEVEIERKKDNGKNNVN